MSEKINNGGSAFPRVTYQGMCIPGMSLLDYFAAHDSLSDFEADCAVVSKELCVALAGNSPSGDRRTNPLEWFKWDSKLRAKMKFIRARAMLEARAEI
jgi:hypothetical protein